MNAPYLFLNGLNELHDGIAILLGQVIELLGGLEGVGLAAVAVPHDRFDNGACATVVQSVVGTRQQA